MESKSGYVKRRGLPDGVVRPHGRTHVQDRHASLRAPPSRPPNWCHAGGGSGGLQDWAPHRVQRAPSRQMLHSVNASRTNARQPRRRVMYRGRFVGDLEPGRWAGPNDWDLNPGRWAGRRGVLSNYRRFCMVALPANSTESSFDTQPFAWRDTAGQPEAVGVPPRTQVQPRSKRLNHRLVAHPWARFQRSSRGRPIDVSVCVKRAWPPPTQKTTDTLVTSPTKAVGSWTAT